MWNFFLPQARTVTQGGRFTLALTAIPGLPAMALGAAIGLPILAATGNTAHWRTAMTGANLAATPVIAPFWVVGRALDAAVA